MRKLLIGLLVACVLFACQKKKDVAVEITVKDKTYEDVGLYLVEMDTLLQLNAEGKASVVLPVNEPQYGLITYKWGKQVIYLEPGAGLTVVWDMTPSGLEIAFEGENDAKNSYISGGELKIPVMGDFGLAEDEFLEKIDQYVENNYKVLESKGFDKTFVEKDKYRIQYDVYGILWQYAQGRNCSDAYYEKMKALMLEDEWLMQLRGYTLFMRGAVETISNRSIDLMTAPKEQIVMNALNYVLENFKSPNIKEYLIGVFAIDYVDEEGISRANDVKRIFDENVTDPIIKQAFTRIYNEGTSITKGKKAPDFKYLDIDGKEVSLSDLRGNLVYIDLWATWCAPCRGELPHLKKLEEMFKGTKIRFVSISTDKDKAKWEETVKSEKLGGIQLHTGGDEAFTKAFRVKGIPHFILIDPEGNILEANMSRPSEAKTMEYLSMYAEPEE